MSVLSPPAQAATQTIEAVVVGPVAPSSSAPLGSLGIQCASGRYGTFEYSDGNGSTLGGLIISCGTWSGEGSPPTLQQTLQLQVFGGTGSYAGAGGSGLFQGVVAYGGLLGSGLAIGSVQFVITTP